MANSHGYICYYCVTGHGHGQCVGRGKVTKRPCQCFTCPAAIAARAGSRGESEVTAPMGQPAVWSACTCTRETVCFQGCKCAAGKAELEAERAKRRKPPMEHYV